MAIHLVRKIEAYTRLSAEERQALLALVANNVRRIPSRQEMIREGERPTHVQLLLDGWAFRHKTLVDGRRQIIAFFLPGDMCDLNITLLREMDHSITSLTSVSVAEISHGVIDALLLRYPRIMRALWWETLVNAAIQREWTVNLGQRTAFERIAHLLCEVFMRLRIVGRTNGQKCEFPVTQAELGEAVGLSTVHVNRTLQEMRAAGLITLNGKELTIIDLPQLQELAMFNPAYLHLDHEGREFDATPA